MDPDDSFQPMTAAEYEEILCSFCRNYPLSYQCPVCQMQACLYCLEKKYKKIKDEGVQCAHCKNIDANGIGMVDPNSRLWA